MASKIKKSEWIALYCVTGAIDIIQFLIDFTGVGEIINEIIDIPIGMALGLYFFVRGAMDVQSALVLALAEVGEEMTAAAGPFWIADVAFTHWKVLKKATLDATIQVANEAASNIVEKIKPLNQDGVRQPSDPSQSRPPIIRNNTQSPFNRNGVRTPRK